LTEKGFISVIVWNVARISSAVVVCLAIASAPPGQAQSVPQQTASVSNPPSATDSAQLPGAHTRDDDQHEKDTVIQNPGQRLPHQRPITTSSIEGLITNPDGRGVIGASVLLRDMSGKARGTMTNGDGVFRLSDLPPGSYRLELRREGFEDFNRQGIQLGSSEVLSVEIKLRSNETTASKGAMNRPVAGAIPPGAGQPDGEEPYRELRRRPTDTTVDQVTVVQSAPTENENFEKKTYRWDLTNGDRKDPLNSYKRYPAPGEYEYTSGHWYDPFNRNKLKGDYPVFGKQTFFEFTGSAVTAVDGRRLPTPSLVAARDPGEYGFFGRGGQLFLSQLFRFTAELNHGDASFRPKDWRIVFTPAFDVNYLATQERGIVNINPQRGTDRFDDHVGLQQAFVEYKIKDLSPNFDFVSVRAGIQQFQSDFRGFIYSEEQPGLRLFGNLKSDRFEYNLAYFYHLEKDTNSGLNTFNDRHQQVGIASLFVQDFLFKGYTTEFSYHYDRDDPTLYYNNNGIITRPEPIGVITPHAIRSHYIGVASNGHIKRVNVSSAFYQVLGYDTDNQVASRRNVSPCPQGFGKCDSVDINAQMAALELSLDKDWLRFRTSFFYASGDKNPRDSTARGFDSIDESQSFAGGEFSFWNREGIRLTSTLIGLKSDNSLFPDLRSSKNEGQANYVNPGAYVYNAGADFDLTPKLRWVVNFNYLQFVHTDPLQLVLFTNHIHRGIGADYGTGFVYRPPLSENIILEGGITGLTPAQGLRDIYTGKTLVSGFALIKFVF
jgi:hypothetical protein